MALCWKEAVEKWMTLVCANTSWPEGILQGSQGYLNSAGEKKRLEPNAIVEITFVCVLGAGQETHFTQNETRFVVTSESMGRSIAPGVRHPDCMGHFLLSDGSLLDTGRWGRTNKRLLGVHLF